MNISTDAYIEDPTPFFRAFVNQIMDQLTRVIVGNIDQSDLHTYDIDQRDQP